jgi:hypothetical protein
LTKKTVFAQVLKEFWFPLCVACVWAFYEWISSKEENKKLADVIKAFGAAFFFVSWLLSQWFRILKQQKLEGGLSSIEQNVTRTLHELESRTKDISFHITGGDSICYFSLIDPINKDGSLPRLALLHHGAHPLYEVTCRISDCDADLEEFGPEPVFSKIYDNQKEIKLGNLSPSLVSVCKVNLELGTGGEKNFLINFYARNGSFMQVLKFKKNGEKFVLATKVTREKSVIFEEIPTNFPLDENGNVGWHSHVEEWP